MTLSKEHKTVVQTIIDRIGQIKTELQAAISKAESELRLESDNIGSIEEELQEKYDDMSEKTQEGDKGQELQGQIEEINSLAEKISSFSFDDIIDEDDDLQEIVDGLEALVK